MPSGVEALVPKGPNNLPDANQRWLEFGNAVQRELRLRKMESDLAELKDFSKKQEDFNKRVKELLDEARHYLFVLAE